MRNFFNSKIVVAITLLLLIFFIGVIGYKVFSGYSLIDAFYMTVITITTVGYGEVTPLNPGEKIFTSVLILSSIFIVGYSIKVISEYILSQNNIGNLRYKQLRKKIESLDGHVIVCGYGRNGQQAVEKLTDYKKEFVVIEINEQEIDRLNESNFLYVEGDAVEDKVLEKAGIMKASTLICTLPKDADNLFIVLSARQLNKNLTIITRASEETSYKKLKLAGANNVIMPDKIGGDHMASLVVVPDLVEFLDNLSVSGEKDSINVEQIPYDKIAKNGDEISLRAIDLRKKTGCSIIGYKKPNGDYIVNPEPTMILEANSKLIAIGRPDQISKLKELYKI